MKKGGIFMFIKKKRLFSLFASLILVLSLILAPIQNIAFAEDSTVKLTIVHTNDVHSRIEGDDAGLIGLPRFATFVKQLEAENPNMLIVDAGDATHGVPIVNISQGEAMIKLMGAVGYDAMAPGNHDFNYGYNRLVELKSMAKFPILGANVVPESGKMDLDEYVIKEVGGLKIGLFGLATPETKYKSSPKNTEGVDITDPIAKAKEIVEKLQAEKVNMIIAISHLGLDEGSEIKSSDLAEQVDGIDLIVDGHSHTLLENGKQIGDTLIVQTGEHLKNVGVVDVTFTDGEITSKEAKLVKFEEIKDLTPDETIAGMIEDLKLKNDEILSEVVGKTNVRLVGEREIVRTQESNLGNLMTDALLDATGADVALTNGGGIRASIEIGDISKKNVLDVFPFGNYGVKLEVTGADIVKALEHGVTDYPSPAGKFPHVAGMTYKIDPSAEPGKRVYDVMIKGQPIDLQKTYTLATNDFMAIGGDEYTMFMDKKIIAEYSAFDEILAEYIQKIGEVNAEVEGRIIVEDREAEVPVEEPVEKPVEKPAEKPVEQPKDTVYVVKPGDVLWKIAKKFNTTWQRLAEYNKLKNPHLIFPGQKILVPAN